MSPRLETDHHRGHAVVRVLADTIDDSNAEPMRKALIETLENTRSRLIVDLEQISVMTSAGLGALVSLQNQARAQGGSIALTNAGAHIAETLRLSNLDRVLKLRSSLDEACDALTGGSP